MLVLFVVSQHKLTDGVGFRVQMSNGTMRLFTLTELRTWPNGDNIIKEFQPCGETSGRPPPKTHVDGPKVGDIVRILLDDWQVCTIHNVHKTTPPRYVVQYDDGMMIEDVLSSDWEFISVASDTISAPEATVDTPAASDLVTAASFYAKVGKLRVTLLAPTLPDANTDAPTRLLRQAEKDHAVLMRELKSM
jgi:hypothetical protein